MEYALLFTVIAGFGGLFYVLMTKGTASGDARLLAELEKERAAHQERQGQNKQLFAQNADLKAEMTRLQKESERLQREVAKHEEAALRKEKEFTERLSVLQKSEQSFQEERARIIREDEAQRQAMMEERDRLWANHEQHVVACLTDLCKQPALSFSAYTNTNLPDGFDGSLKPDFMIDFLGQYIIFDAKVSKAKSLKAYVDDQVKKTVEKVKGDERIHPWIFLVVPSTSLSELRTFHYTVEGYQLYVVSVESLPAILASFKHITRYEFAEQMDPQKRENIVQLLAEMDFHINLRNAADLILTKMGTDMLEKASRLDPEIAQEVEIKKQPMNMKASLASSELRKLASSFELQEDTVVTLASPKVAVKKKDLQRAKEAIIERLR